MPRSLIDGTSSGVWAKQAAGSVQAAAAVLNTSPTVAAVTTSGAGSSVQRAAQAVARMPQLRRVTNRSRRIIW